jgi:hypothetical protein
MRISLVLRALTAVVVSALLIPFIGRDLPRAAAAPRSVAARPAAPVVVAAVRPPVVRPEVPAVAVPSAARRVPAGPPRVVLYGDSLGWEAQRPFRAALAAAGITQVSIRTFGGTAICDWLAQMRADEIALHPDAVVVEFSGNALTPCMKALDGSALSTADYYAKYQQDARSVLNIFTRTATVYLVGTPISEHAALAHDPNGGRLNSLYQSLAARTLQAHFVAAGAAVTLIGGGWTHTLPCLQGEPCTGGIDAQGRRVNVVRAPDGTHFCPVAHPAIHGVVESCPVYSSGAYRFGSAMANAVIADFSTMAATA